MAGLQGARTGLTPAGHSRVDQFLVDLGAIVGSQAEALGDAGPETLDEHIGLGDQIEHELLAFSRFQIGGDAAPVAQHGVLCRAVRGGWAVHPHHVGPEISQNHCGVRAGADAGQFDNPQSVQWSRHTDRPSSLNTSSSTELVDRRHSLRV